ncbi:hypothetical protein FACS1894201_10950 [Bacteroidia bacterium]|nr:hypothetical protein FACS1894201_10950 [Bacteroidia bacterium]
MNNMKDYLTLTILLCSFLTLNGQEVSRAEMKNKPANLEEAVIQLTKILPDTTQQEILSMTEEKFLEGSHFGLGMWIRNNWGLWRGGKLAKDFNAKGIFHPDDMSGIILKCYYRQLHNQDWKLDEQIAFYQNYWKRRQEYQYRLENNTAFAQQEKNNYESSIREENEKLKMEFPIDARVKVWVDHSDFALRTQIIGEVVDWRVTVSKGGHLGYSRKGPEINNEYLEAKVRVIEYMNIKKKKRIERYNKMKDNELWVSVGLMSKIEE